MNLHLHADKLAYFFIAISLLASNMPRVLDIPLHYVYPVRCIEVFTFGTAVVCFLVLWNCRS